MKSKIFTIFMVLTMVTGLIITQTSCSGKAEGEPVTKENYSLDTVCQITIYNMTGMSEEKAGEVIDGAFALCTEYENILSKTREGSDIYKINHAKGQGVECDRRTIDVLKLAIEYGQLSKGKFDVTIGKVTDLWDFHSSEGALPKEEDIKAALPMVDYKQIKIDGNVVTMGNSQGEIDLGGIAKGYIGDRLSDYLKEEGVSSAIISLGGNIVAIGDKDGEDFTIGVEKPYSDRSEIVGSVSVSNSTVVTSGIYERYIEVDGKKYHHILDVNTGYPVDSDIEGVSLVGGEGRSADCDALSTICLMLGVKEGKALIESVEGIEALFIDKNGKITMTEGFKLNEE